MHRFDSDAQVAVDLLAAKPSRTDAERQPVEFQPPRNYLCYLRYDSRVFLSGYTSDKETLDDQVPQVISAVAGGLTVAGTGWDKLVKVSLFLHRSHKLQTLKTCLGKDRLFQLAARLSSVSSTGMRVKKACSKLKPPPQ
jgi:hypothetical protein